MATAFYLKLFYNPNMNNKTTKLYSLGREIFNQRKRCGYSQNELAERLDISREHLAKIETAKRSPSLELLIEISEKLNVKLKDLINF